MGYRLIGPNGVREREFDMMGLQKVDGRPKAAWVKMREVFMQLESERSARGGCLRVKHSAPVEAADRWADDKDARSRGCNGLSRDRVGGRYWRAGGEQLRVCHTRSCYAKLRCFVLPPKAGS
jgi:hypothetical protein